MSGNHRHDSPGADAGLHGSADGFLRRWSERKSATQADGRRPEDVLEDEPVVIASIPETPSNDGLQKTLTDEDMPVLETLNETSDYSGFLSPGVSDALRRIALRQLFSADKFNLRDGLDDYDNDYNLLLPLRSVLAEATRGELNQQMRDQLAQEPAVTPADVRVDSGTAMQTPDAEGDSDQFETVQQEAPPDRPASTTRETES